MTGWDRNEAPAPADTAPPQQHLTPSRSGPYVIKKLGRQVTSVHRASGQALSFSHSPVTLLLAEKGPCAAVQLWSPAW